MKNKLWFALIIFSVVFPFIAMAYEMGRLSPFANIVYVVITLVWFAVIFLALRVKDTSNDEVDDVDSQGSSPK
ncbi:MAG: hypothetical protein AAGF95_14245 [Chloroflexota bacterium]